MINLAETERALRGTWRFFLGKPDAIKFFDTGIDGFWRSFQAIVLVAPSYAVAALSDRIAIIGGLPPGTFNEGEFWSTKVVSLCFDWMAFPILLAAIASFIGIRSGYVAFIAVRNWATVVMTAPFAVIAALQAIGISEDLLFLPSLAALAFSLRLSYMVARRTLGAPVDVAVALVLLDWLVSLAVVIAANQVTGYAMTS